MLVSANRGDRTKENPNTEHYLTSVPYPHHLCGSEEPRYFYYI